VCVVRRRGTAGGKEILKCDSHMLPFERYGDPTYPEG